MELVETEKDYVRDLTSVVEGYIANLEQMELPQELQVCLFDIFDFFRPYPLKRLL